MNKIKDLVNMPSNELTPKKFVNIAENIAKEKKIKIEIFNVGELRKLGAGAFLGVSSGAKNPPYMVKLSYKNKKNKKTLGLVGKGITFDSGGISIKPSKGMWEMKGDMAGAATVLCFMELLDFIKPNINVTAVLPLTENMPDGGAYKPGDVLKTISGKSIEILNTDAEGRLILADALCLIQKEKLDCLIDIATLTGAARIALGSKISAIMGNNKDLVKKIINSGEKTSEIFWEMPLLEEYRNLLKSKIADIKNCQDSGGEAGTIIGGIFLKEFVDDKVKWAHLDIAATSGFQKDKGYQTGGVTGVGLRTLVELLRVL
jgi:leucyl aminopeptidase